MKPDEYAGKTGKFPYPSDDIDPRKKQENEWYLSVVTALMSDYTSNNCVVPYSYSGESRSISELRRYAKGRQSSDKIKKWILGSKRKTSDGKYITKMNVSWDTYAKLPQMFDIMRERNMSQEYDVDLTCIDPDSVGAMEQTREALKFLIDQHTDWFVRTSMFKPNFDPDPQLLGLRTAQDVDMWMDTGGFTVEWQKAAQAACQKTKIVSNYKEFQDLVFDDLIINPEGITGARTYIEKSTGLPKIRKVNMERAIIPYFEGLDSKDKITRAAELRIMTIADVRRENPELTAPQLLKLAKDFAWMNPQYATVIEKDGFYGYERQGAQAYDLDPISRVKVIVMDAQWLSCDIEHYLKNDETGLFKEVDYDYRLKKKAIKDGDYSVKKKVIKKYEAEWIVGTELFLKKGVCKDQVYYGEDGNKTPSLDFFFVKTGNMSLVERCIAIVDQIDMIMVKHRNAWATLPATPAMAIQKDLLENVFLNGILQQPDDIIQTYIERGILYYNGIDDFGKPLYPAGGAKPIDYMDAAKMAALLQVCSNEIALKIIELKEVLGLQGGVDGGQKDRYQGLGETEMYFEASNASLRPTFNAFQYLFKNVFTDIIKKWQITAKDKELKLPYSLLGNKSMKMLELGGNFSAADFNVGVRIAPTNQERASLLKELAQLRAENSQSGGMTGITRSEYIYVYDRIMAGNIKEAQFVLAQIERKRKQEADEKEMRNIEANAQVQQQSASMKAQADKDNLETKGRMQNDNTIIAALLKQNQSMLEALVSPTKEGERGADKAAAMATIEKNTQDVAAIVDSTSPEAQAIQDAQMAQEAEMQGADTMPLM